MLYGNMPLTESRGGVALPEFLILPPTSRVAAYVYSGGSRAEDTTYIRNNTVQTLAAAIDRVRSGAGDTIIVRRGHSESVVDATMFANIEAGTTIVGEGSPRQSNAPTFSWTTAATANWTLDQANITIQNLRLLIDGYNGVTSGLTVTAAGCRITGNVIRLTQDTDLHAVTGITVDGAGHDCEIYNNFIYGAPAGSAITQAILIDDSLTTIPLRTHVVGNTIQVPGAVGTSCVTVSCAATELLIKGNILANLTALSTTTIHISDNNACTGVICDNYSSILKTDGTTAAEGIVLGGTEDVMHCFNNITADVRATSGILAPAATT